MKIYKAIVLKFFFVCKYALGKEKIYFSIYADAVHACIRAFNVLEEYQEECSYWP
jgi:hypothetical protein